MQPRRTVDTHVSLRGRVLTITHAGGREDKTVLESPGELVTTLRSRFDLDVPEAATLWPAICARHDAVFSKPQKGRLGAQSQRDDERRHRDERS